MPACRPRPSRETLARARRHGLTAPQLRVLAGLGAYARIGATPAQIASGVMGGSRNARIAVAVLERLAAAGFAERTPDGWRTTAKGDAVFSGGD